MNFTAPADVLAKAASIAKKHATAPVVLEPGDVATLLARSYTLRLWQRLPFAARGPAVAIDASDFAQHTKSLAGTVAAKVDGARFVLSAGKRKTTTGALDPNEADAMPTVHGAAHAVRADALRTAIQRVRAASATEGGEKAHLSGVLLEFCGDALRSIATNGHWFALYGDAAPEATLSVLLPAPLVSALLDLLPAEGTVTIASDDRWVRVDAVEWAVAHTFPAQTFPSSWKHVLSAASGRVLTAHLDRAAFHADAAAVAASGGSALRIALGDAAVAMTSRGSDRDAEGATEAKIQPSDSRGFAFVEASYLLAALGTLPAGEIAFSMSGGELDPFVLEPADSSGVIVLMPRRE